MVEMVRSHEKRRRLFEEPTQSQISTSILKYDEKTHDDSTPEGVCRESYPGLAKRELPHRYSSYCKDNYFTELCSGSEAGSYLRLIDSCITQRNVRDVDWSPCHICHQEPLLSCARVHASCTNRLQCQCRRQRPCGGPSGGVALYEPGTPAFNASGLDRGRNRILLRRISRK